MATGIDTSDSKLLNAENELSLRLDLLDNTIAELQNRLEPALRPATPVPSDPSVTNKDNALADRSNLLIRLETKRNIVDNAINRLRFILDHLDL